MFGIHRDGGYAESMIAPARALVAVPSELNSTEAAPLLCAGVTTFSALRESRARAGDLVGIQGIGGLGHLAIQFARYMGFRVVAIARGTTKKNLALTLGAHHYIDSTDQDAAQELQKLGGARVIVSTAANSGSQSALVPGLAPRGQMIVVGAGGNTPVALNPIDLLFGERGVEGTMTGSVADTDDALAFSVLQNIRPIIESYPLEQADQAFQRMMSNEARFRAVLAMNR
jgi:D-arabinose 1-dehydrogenase-like Zn-dependent alcohol dehydrogenase